MSSKYEVLYNKYRPSSIAELVGQDHITLLINSQIKNKTIPNCLIFHGPAGTGKTTLARIIARDLNPSKYGTIEIDSALDGGKDSIKVIQQEVYNIPYEGTYKTYIFDEAHELTRQSFASLLKTLEEPPSHARFILITNDFDKIPLNIKSRAQAHNFVLISHDVIEERLKFILSEENKKLPNDLLKLAVQFSGGSLRNAITALDVILNSLNAKIAEDKIPETLGVLGNKKITSLIVSYIKKDFKELSKSIKFFSSENIDPQKAISELQQFLMDCRLFFIDPSIEKELRTEVSLFIEELSRIVNKKFSDFSISERKTIGRIFDKIYDISLVTESNLKKTQNKNSLFTRFIIQLAASWNE